MYANDYKMYAEGGGESIDIEWDAGVGKFDSWDLPPFEDFDPKVCSVSFVQEFSVLSWALQMTSLNPLDLSTLVNG